MVRILRFATMIAAVACLGFVVLGYLGALHPAGDSLAVFRMPLAALALALLALARPPLWLRLAGGAVIGVALIGRLALMLPTQAPDAPFTLYQKNLLYLQANRAPLIADILSSRPDAVTLQEVSEANRPLLAALREALPSQHYCPFAAVGGVAVLSPHPMVPGSTICVKGGGIAAMQVDTGRGRLWIVGLHLHWPWPHRQAAHVDGLLPALRALQGPRLIGGDFNAVGWSHTVARIEAATGTRRAGRLNLTFTLPQVPMQIGIDHVLGDPDRPARVEPRPRLGSDHNGLLARLYAAPG